jgi:hypothetical protein
MRTTVATLLSILSLVGIAATPASAAPLARIAVPPGAAGSDEGLVGGLRLAGADVVWARSAPDGSRGEDIMAVPATGGTPRLLAHRVPDVPGHPNAWIDVDLAAGAGGVVAWNERLGERLGDDGPRVDLGVRTVGGPVGGPPAVLGTCPGGIAVDGTRVAYVDGSACDTVVVRDLVADREVARIAVPGGGPADLRLAGDYVAWRPATPPAPRVIVVASLVTGAVVMSSLDPATGGFVLGPDGALGLEVTVPAEAVPLTSPVLVRRSFGGTDRVVADWPDSASNALMVGVAGDAIVTQRLLLGRASHSADGDTVVALAPDGRTRPLLRHLDRPTTPHLHANGPYAALDTEGGRLAWAVRTCDEIDVEASAIADLPPDGVDLGGPEHCRRPVLERRSVRLDRRGRGTVALRCPAACAGTLRLDGTTAAHPGPVMQRTFALDAGRHRLAVLLSPAERTWVAHGGAAGRAVRLAIGATLDGRPGDVYATLRVRPPGR